MLYRLARVRRIGSTNAWPTRPYFRYRHSRPDHRPQIRRIRCPSHARLQSRAGRRLHPLRPRGIASVWSKQDSFEEHKQDTLIAGAGLCHEDIVELTVREGPARVQELIDFGVEFTRTEQRPARRPDRSLRPAP